MGIARSRSDKEEARLSAKAAEEQRRKAEEVQFRDKGTSTVRPTHYEQDLADEDTIGSDRSQPPPSQRSEVSWWGWMWGQSPEVVKCLQKSDLRRPKKALSPYNCFVRSQLRKSSGETDLTSISNHWKSIPESEKRPYYQEADADKQRYMQEMAAYEAKKQQVIKRPKNGYIIFMRKFRRDNRREYPDPKQLTRAGARAWRRLSPSEKEPYNTESLKDSERYASERLRYCRQVVPKRKGDTRTRGSRRIEDEDMDMD